MITHTYYYSGEVRDWTGSPPGCEASALKGIVPRPGHARGKGIVEATRGGARQRTSDAPSPRDEGSMAGAVRRQSDLAQICPVGGRAADRVANRGVDCSVE